MDAFAREAGDSWAGEEGDASKGADVISYLKSLHEGVWTKRGKSAQSAQVGAAKSSTCWTIPRPPLWSSVPHEQVRPGCCWTEARFV